MDYLPVAIAAPNFLNIDMTLGQDMANNQGLKLQSSTSL
jgi:hypothetical protein